MIIRRKVKLRPHQGWSDKLLEYLHPVPYEDWRVAEYEAGIWESEELMEAYVGDTYEGENARYVYEHEILSDAEKNIWTTYSGVNI